MPRRANDVVHLPLHPKKKLKIVETPPPPSLDVSFADGEALTPGVVFTDIQENKWRIGKPIGRGSFGRIYLASDDDKEVTKVNARYVVKIEPHTNGPLFVEVHCLIRTAQTEKVIAWRRQNKLKRLGMPVYIASGSYTDENTDTKYRFLVLPRYDIDLQKVIARTKVLDLKNVLVLAIQILDVLEYLHNEGYTHSDIKSSNLMLGFDGGRANKVPIVKPAPSFQKEIKEVAVLSGKQRRPKSGKSRASNYYEDEDFIVKDFKSGNNSEEECEGDKRLANVKRKLRKMLTDKDSRKLHRQHAFNLRQLSNYVNYEDLNSSVCSDQSYQKLLDDFGTKQLVHSTDEDTNKSGNFKTGSEINSAEIHKEAVLSQSNGQIYLLDYGLASKFLDSEGNHKDFGMDARKAHDGTLEYSSRDSHIGAHSRRSDLETLGYNLLDWLTGSLPWKTKEVLAEPDLVHALKKNFMSDVKALIKACFKGDYYPMFMEKYLEYVTKLDFAEKPDYDYCRSLFKSELLRNGYSKDICLNFAEILMPPASRKQCYSKRFSKKNTPTDFIARNGIKKTYERENVCSIENNLKLELMKQTLNSSSDGIRKPCTSRNFFISDADLVTRLKKYLMPYDILGKKLSPKNLRSKKNNGPKRRGMKRQRNSIGKFGNFMGSSRQFSWAEILAGNPEDIIRKERNTIVNVENEDDDDVCKYRIRKLSNASSGENADLQSPLMQKDYLQNANPTYAMKEVLANFMKKVSGKLVKETDEPIEGLEGYTPAMIKVVRMREKRLAKEKQEDLKQQNLTKKEAVVVIPRHTRSVTAKSNTRGTRQKLDIETKEKTNMSTDKSLKTNARKSNKENPKVNIKEKVAIEIPTKINEEKQIKSNKTKSTRLTRLVAGKKEKLDKEKSIKINESKSQSTRQKHSSDIKKYKINLDKTEQIENPKMARSTRITRQTCTVDIEKMDLDITPNNNKCTVEIEKMDVDIIAKNIRTRSKVNKNVSKDKKGIVKNKLTSVTIKKSSPKTKISVPVPKNRIRRRSNRIHKQKMCN